MSREIQPAPPDANDESPQDRKSIWREGITLVALILIAGGVWFFIEVADEVSEGDAHAIDRKILLAMRNPADLNDPWGPDWLEEIGRDFTALGGMAILVLVTVATSLGLLLVRRWPTAVLILVAIIGGLLLSLALKRGFDRPRPDLVPHGSIVYTQSFPSGHAMLAAVTYLTLGFLIVRTLRHRRLKIYILTLVILTTVLVGVSRVYLGVHWPTDVLAGWAAGAVWALLCWFIARWLQKRGAVD